MDVVTVPWFISGGDDEDGMMMGSGMEQNERIMRVSRCFIELSLWHSGKLLSRCVRSAWVHFQVFVNKF